MARLMEFFIAASIVVLFAVALTHAVPQLSSKDISKARAAFFALSYLGFSALWFSDGEDIAQLGACLISLVLSFAPYAAVFAPAVPLAFMGKYAVMCSLCLALFTFRQKESLLFFAPVFAYFSLLWANAGIYRIYDLNFALIFSFLSVAITLSFAIFYWAGKWLFSRLAPSVAADRA